MPAQLIYIRSNEQESGSEEAAEGKGTKEKGASAGGKKKRPPRTSKFPPWHPLPSGTFKIFGKKVVDIGHFDSMPLLLESVKSKTLPGGSNTLLATVKDLSAPGEESLKEDLAELPDELTIIVKQGATGSPAWHSLKFPPFQPLRKPASHPLEMGAQVPLISTVEVLGQEPVHIGHFDSVPLLLESVKSGKLPGGSNTVFATVKQAGEPLTELLEAEIAELPEEMTIIVTPKA